MINLFNSGIRPSIDAWLLEKSKEVRSYGDYWSASSAGMCQRLVIMRRLGVPPVPEILEGNARLQRVFQSGHLFHEFFQRITKDAGLSIAQELELQDEELMIRGHIDDLVLVTASDHPAKLTQHDFADDEDIDGEPQGVPKHLILYDYKSQNSKAFNYKRPEMSHLHRLQLGTYMYMLRKMGEIERVSTHDTEPESKEFVHTFSTRYERLPLNDLTEARILKFDKDTMRMEEEQLMWDTQLESDVLSYWKTLNGHWKNQKMPPCTCLEHDGGFMGRRTKDGRIFNDYFYEDEPCSLKYYRQWKKEEKV